MKKRLSVWSHGGLGSGAHSQGQPCIHNLIKRLSSQYNIDVYVLAPPDPTFVAEGFTMRASKLNANWGRLRWLDLIVIFIRQHRKNNYDLLYSFWGYPSGLLIVLLGALFNKPSVIHLQGGDAAYVPSLNYGAFSHPLRRKLCAWTYSRCSTLIALTAYQKKFLTAFGVTRPVLVIPYGVDTGVFSYQPRNKSSTIRFLHIGNQTPVKDQETTLRAFAAVRMRIPATLTMIGADHAEGAIRRLCANLAIEPYVTLLSPRRYADLPSCYHEADVLLHTSLYEGQGLVFTEAAACGTLLAGTGVGVLSDMGEKCGIIVQPGDADGLAAQILEVLKSPDVMIAKRNAARSWAEEKNEDFTVRTVVEALNTHLLRS